MLKIAHHPIYRHPLPEGHRFPMEKYELLPQQLLHEGTCTNENFFTPTEVSEEYVLAVHTLAYLRQLKDGALTYRQQRAIGFPLSPTLVERELIITEGTIQGCEYALEHGVAMNIAGGTHHAYQDLGEAFCLLNDQAIGARYLQNTGKAAQVLIVDLDVHQGNGTAVIFQGDDSVFTFSMHGKNNYPFRKEQSDLDIPLEDGCTDSAYLGILEKTFPYLIDQVKPDFVFYLCGVDVIEGDKLGRLGLSMEGCRQRDVFVLQTCKEHNIPVQCSMGGGYSPDIKVIVDAHAQTFRMAQEVYF